MEDDFVAKLGVEIEEIFVLIFGKSNACDCMGNSVLRFDFY